MNKSVLILNGPGLANLSAYAEFHNGTLSLSAIRSECESVSQELGLDLDFRQTENQEEMFRWIAKDSEAFDGVVINPVGHSRAAIQIFELYRSAIQMIANLKKPIVEVHITNIYRHIEEVTQPLHEPVGEMGFICGFGKYSYVLALQAIARKLGVSKPS